MQILRLRAAAVLLIALVAIGCNPGGGGQSSPAAPAGTAPTVVDDDGY